MRVAVEDPNIIEINTCTFNDGGNNKPGIIFLVNPSDNPYEIIFSRDELSKMIEAIEKNEIFQ